MIAVLEAQCDDDSEVMEVRLGMGKYAVLYDCNADLSNLETRALLVYTGSLDAREVGAGIQITFLCQKVPYMSVTI